MHKNYVLTISEDYPESYWLKMEILSAEDPIIFSGGAPIEKDVKVRFEAAKKVSTERLLAYDFFYADGAKLISPRLCELMMREDISGVQFIDAELVVGGRVQFGYKLLHITRIVPAFDLEKSFSRPLLNYIPEGPKWFEAIVLKENCELPNDIIRAEEQTTTIVVNSRVKSIFESNNVRGVSFKA
ncbi:imm11 family protein [Pseudomonas alabamensis]|uniref:imm11 family protein n=1 Tax=Pseudomonas alabamensis TaxID=3064349 RepID=UPI00119EDF89